MYNNAWKHKTCEGRSYMKVEFLLYERRSYNIIQM